MDRVDKIELTRAYLGIIIITILMCLAFTPSVNASLGTFKQNECIQLLGSSDAPSMNISSITYPLNSTIQSLSSPMTKNDKTFNYTFCNTSIPGDYIYNYYDSSGNIWVNDFRITPTGYDAENSDMYMFIIGLVILILVTIFFFILSNMMKAPGTKIFFMGLTVLNAIVLIGLVVSNSQSFLWKFVSYNSLYDKYYILLTIGGTILGIGLILWLVKFAFEQFYKSRNMIPDDYK